MKLKIDLDLILILFNFVDVKERCDPITVFFSLFFIFTLTLIMVIIHVD